MTNRDLRADVDALLDHSGLREKLDAKAVANRESICAEARAKKRDAEKRFIAERARIQSQLDAADKKQVDAQKAAEAAMLEWIKLREQFSTVHESKTATDNTHDAILRKHADPAIAAFVAELRGLLEACPQLYRTFEDAAGKVVDNRVAVDLRIRSIRELIEQSERLTTANDVENTSAEIERIRNSIPKV